MSALEIKGSLFDLLWKETDQEVLSKIKEFAVEIIRQKKEGKVDGWSDLPPEFQERLMKAYNDFKNGAKGIPHEEVMRRSQERFKNFPK